VGCPVCKRLERTFEGWNSECLRARSSLYYSVTARFAAYDNVEMERARSELQMHRSVCVLAATKAAGLRLAHVAPSSPRREKMRTVPAGVPGTRSLRAGVADETRGNHPPTSTALPQDRRESAPNIA
jgi:hypothetical protein